MSVTTSSLVSKIINLYAPSYSRAVILDLINQKQKILANTDCAQMTWLNSADDYFPIPFLNTVSGTLKYVVSASNLLDSDGAAVSITVGGYTVTPRKIKNIFTTSTLSTTIDPNRRFMGDAFSWSGINENWFRVLGSTTFVKEPVILYDRTNIQGPVVQFIQDPGTHTDRFYCEFYYAPLDLTSESIPLSIDGDLWEEALLDGVVGEIEKIEHGENSRLQRFENYWMKKFIRKMDANVPAAKPLAMRIRECG